MILDQLTLLLDMESSWIKVSRNTPVDYRLPKYFGNFSQNMVIKLRTEFSHSPKLQLIKFLPKAAQNSTSLTPFSPKPPFS